MQGAPAAGQRGQVGGARSVARGHPAARAAARVRRDGAAGLAARQEQAHRQHLQRGHGHGGGVRHGQRARRDGHGRDAAEGQRPQRFRLHGTRPGGIRPAGPRRRQRDGGGRDVQVVLAEGVGDADTNAASA